MNVRSFAGGCDLWGDVGMEKVEHPAASASRDKPGRERESGHDARRPRSFPQPSLRDGKLEVVGVQGITHLGAAQVGLYSGKRLAQASRVKITNKDSLAVQVDGEPFWFAENGSIDISFQSQALLLERKSAASAKSRPFESALMLHGCDATEPMPSFTDNVAEAHD